jgi:hypothetical protein
MNLLEHSKCLNIGQQILVLPKNVEQKLRVNDPKNQDLIKRSFARGSHSEIVKLIFSQNVRLDSILGEFPTLLKFGRATLHALKLSHAVLITMKVFKLTTIPFPQRGKGKWKMSSKNLLSTLFNHYLFALSGLEETDIIKKIKTSLASFVSESLKQDELPQGERFSIFPSHMTRVLKCLQKREQLEQFAFSVLQSKSLLQEVPETFVQAGLEKHRSQLSQPQKVVSEEYLEKLRQRGREFGKLVAGLYRPEVGFQPSGNASFAFPRDRGGLKGDLVYNDRLQIATHTEDPDDRIEPYVIGLFGQPGMGKSTVIPELVASLSRLFPGVPSKDLTYERTSHVEHWDGYSGQPIVILDDLGQSQSGQDIQEFQTLVSCCPYVLPMASLEDKGRKFSSPIIIATSNLKYGMSLAHVYPQGNSIIDDASFWRRFHVPTYVEDGNLHLLRLKPSWIRTENLYMRKGLKMCQGSVKSIPDSRFFQNRHEFCVEISGKPGDYTQQVWRAADKAELLKDLQIEFKVRRKFHENHGKVWKQCVSSSTRDTSKITPYLQELEQHGFSTSTGHLSGDGKTLQLNFPAFPPEGPLPVRVEPIKEPLKVRLITAGIGDTFCLKPFAKAMWQALGLEPQFALTHGTTNLSSTIKRLYKSGKPGDVWISGDYTAATDSFPLEATKALLTGILESTEHEPTKRWALKEISAHLLVYPNSSGLEPVLQESGQLMGSLLSFPLLCLLNDCTARFSGILPDSYTINGDDILMRTSAENYPIGKRQQTHSVLNFQ